MNNGNSTDLLEVIKIFSEIALSFFAVVISVIALFQTKKQTTISNKHQLFDRRLEKYKILKDLLSAYESTREALLEDNNIELSGDVYLTALIDIPCMRDILSVVDEPLEDKNRKKYFDKCNWLSKTSIEVKIIFKGTPAETMSEFCVGYLRLLQIIYFEYAKTEYELDKSIAEQLGEISDFQEMYFFPSDKTIKDSVNSIEKVYRQIIDKNMENRLIKQIKL